MAFVISFLLRRLAQGALIVLLVAFLIFSLLRIIPGDPVRIMLGPMAPTNVVEEMGQKLGLRDPIPIQFGRYIAGLVQGDLGRSYIRSEGGATFGGGRDRGEAQVGQGARVFPMIMDALPLTLQLAGLGVAMALLISIPLGIAAGLNADRWPDKLAFITSSVFVSLPNFWFGLVLILVLSARLNWMPAIGYGGFAYTILPALVLAIELSPIIIRSLSVAVAANVQQNYVSMGVIRGLSHRQMISRHVLRNSSIPLLNLFGVQLGGLLLGGVFVVEYIFDYPGLGNLTIKAVLQRDFPVIQGVAILASSVLVLINILVDLLSTYIDRRLQY
jgi:peptide/nickel transport system permease protein